jgi:hypothetical protein
MPRLGCGSTRLATRRPFLATKRRPERIIGRIGEVIQSPKVIHPVTLTPRWPVKGPDTQPFRRHDDALKKSPTFNPGKWAKIRSATSDGGRSRIRDPIYVSCSAFGFEEVVLVLLALGETPA